MIRGACEKVVWVVALLILSACAPKRLLSTPQNGSVLRAPVEGAREAYRLKQGDYLSERYMRRLLATGSPVEAAEGCGPYCAWVMPLERCVMCVDLGDFTRGWGCLSLWPDGTARTGNKAYFAGGAPSFRVLDATHFELDIVDMAPMRFAYVENAGAWVASTVFLGIYRGSQGQECVFGPNGWAILPDGAHPFDLRLDLQGRSFDAVEIQGCLYEWKRRGDHLLLYPLRDGDGGVSAGRPAFALKLIRRGIAQNHSVKPSSVKVPQRKIIIKSFTVSSQGDAPTRR